MKNENSVYTHGHHESVLRSHKWRTVENSASFLLPYLKDGVQLLDAGCGPGNITAGLAALIPNGKAVGIDFSAEIISQAQNEYPSEKFENLEFQQGDIYELQFEDETFDLIYIHQVLQHLSDPVRTLKEIKRVLKPNGIIALRESDYSAFTWFPELPELDRWRELYREVTQHNGAESNGGKFLKSWVMQAGMELAEISCTTWVFSSEGDRAWWGGLWSKRATESDFAKQAIAYGLSTKEELEAIAESFISWSKEPEGLWTIPNMEVIARKS